MIIAIDGYEANADKRVGIGRYAFELLSELYRQAPGRPQAEFRIYVPKKPRIDMPKETYWWQYRIVWPRRFWTYFGLPLHLLFDRPQADVVFSPTHYIPRFTSLPRVMSVMDLSYLMYPQLFRKNDLYKLTKWTSYAVMHASHIFTISQFSRNAIMDSYRIPQNRITVTYPGFSMNTTSGSQDVCKKYKCTNPYILSVGTIQPRKNYEALIEAFSEYVTSSGDRKTDLVIVGKKGWLFEKILQAPKQFGIEDRVRFLSFIPDADLPSLYAHALCFVLPSLYEGFGLPVLEAMAVGCPVVVSRSSSLPEIAGKAGIYIDPKDTHAIAQGIETAMREKGSAAGRKRVELGKKLAKSFTWDRAAKQTIEILEHVAKEKGTQ